MSNVSIYEKNWIDLVFEDKNKSYGAYQLRQDNQKTTLLALFSGITFVLAPMAIWLLFSSFDAKASVKPKDNEEVIIKITDVKYPKKETFKPKAEKPQAAAPVTENKFKKYVASKEPENVDVPKNTDIIPQTTTTGTDVGTGTRVDTPTNGGGSPTGTVMTPTIPDNNTRLTSELDRLPEYPGGIKRFYDYVGNNFEKPEDDGRVSSMNVIMSFVIERDGSMTDIKVLRSSDKSIEREAIRVLKSLKIKWSPGFKDGEKVRVLYTLPIKVAL